MDMEKRIHVSYQVKGQHAYLVIDPGMDVEVIDYCARMVETNQIPCLLPLHRQTIDEVTRLNYDITGKTKLLDYAKHNSIDSIQGKKILENLINGLNNLHHYFLSIVQCLLQEDYLFIDDYFNVYLPYLPLDKPTVGDTDKVMKEFLLTLIGSCLVSPERNDDYGTLINQLISPQFSFLAFSKGFAAPPKQPKIKPIPRARQELTDNHEEIPTPKQVNGVPNIENPSHKSVESPSVNGIKIPGGLSLPKITNTSEKEKKPKKEKSKDEEKGLKLFGIQMGRKKKVPQVEMEKENHLLPKRSPERHKVQPVPQQGQQQKDSGNSWVGTEMLGVQDSKGNQTEFLGQDNQHRAYLVHKGKNVEISENPFLIGKVSASYQILDPAISRQHATITLVDGDYYIQDENSKNRTYLDGTVIPPYSPILLKDGSVIKLGKEEMTFHLGG